MSRTLQHILLFTLLLLADQASKYWIEQQLPFYHFTVIDGFFNIVKAHNFGVAFSMFAEWNHQWRTTLLLGVTMGISIAVFVWWLKTRNKPGLEPWLLVLILAGASGNIWDRLQLGYVVDFIQWYVVIGGKGYYWPAFNIADACISVAVVLMLIHSFRKSS